MIGKFTILKDKRVLKFTINGSFDSLLQNSNYDNWYSSEIIHPCSIKDFTKLAKKVGFKINEIYDVKRNKKFIFPNSPSNIFCKEALFHLST